MTDLERALQRVHPLIRNDLRNAVDVALAAARQEGAEEMREQAAVHLRDRAKKWRVWGQSDFAVATDSAAEAVTALPLTPKEPEV